MENAKSTTFSKSHLMAVAMIVLVVAGGAFYGGTKFAQAKRGSAGRVGANGQFVRMNGQAGLTADANRGPGQGRGARGMFGGAIAGEIIAKDDKSITIKMPDGGTKIVFFGGDVKVSKSSSAAVDDLKEGEQAMVMGSANADGSVTAQSIRLGEQPFMRVLAPGQGAASGSGDQGR